MRSGLLGLFEVELGEMQHQLGWLHQVLRQGKSFHSWWAKWSRQRCSLHCWVLSWWEMELRCSCWSYKLRYRDIGLELQRGSLEVVLSEDFRRHRAPKPSCLMSKLVSDLERSVLFGSWGLYTNVSKTLWWLPNKLPILGYLHEREHFWLGPKMQRWVWPEICCQNLGWSRPFKKGRVSRITLALSQRLLQLEEAE